MAALIASRVTETPEIVELTALIAKHLDVNVDGLYANETDELGLTYLRLAHQLEALGLGLIGESHDNRFPEFAGYISNTTHLSAELNISPFTASRHRKAAAFMHHWPIIGQALRDGTITLDHVHAMATVARNRATEFEHHLDALLNMAGRVGFEEFEKQLTAWATANSDNPDAQDELEDTFNGRALNMRRRLDGSSQGTFSFDPETTVLLEEFLDNMDNPTSADERTPTQRRADSFTNMLTSFMNGDPEHYGLTNYVLNVIVNADHLHGSGPTIGNTVGARTLDGNTVIGQQLLEQLMCDGSYRTVTHNTDGQVLLITKATGDLTPSTRLAVKTRDRHCQFQGCTRPSAQGHIHHIQERHKGGTNQLDNLVLVCGHHHRVLHATAYRIRRRTNGTFETPGLFETLWDGPIRDTETPASIAAELARRKRYNHKHAA